MRVLNVFRVVSRVGGSNFKIILALKFSQTLGGAGFEKNGIGVVEWRQGVNINSSLPTGTKGRCFLGHSGPCCVFLPDVF